MIGRGSADGALLASAAAASTSCSRIRASWRHKTSAPARVMHMAAEPQLVMFALSSLNAAGRGGPG
eukprot:7666770-Lingulodinium_polyedra.AAC.1